MVKMLKKRGFRYIIWLKTLKNLQLGELIRQFVCCFLSIQDVEFNHQKQMQGGIYGKENNRQIHISIA